MYSAAYFQAREIGEAKNTRIPIMIVGKDRAGKTSLKKHLLGRPFDCEESSTNGIEVDVVELTDGNAADPWGKKETTFFTSVNEAEEKVLEHTAQLFMDEENIEVNRALRTVEIALEPTLSQEVVDRIDELRAENFDRENPTTIFVHDFAGQSIFHDTHFCFLKMQCPYVLVVDLNSPLDEEATPRFKLKNSEGVLHDPFLETNLDYSLSWLTVLARLSDFYSEISPDNHPEFKLPPVVVALTNSDQCKDKEDIVKVKERIQRILVQKAFQNVFSEIFVIDNTLNDRSGEEIQRLRRKLYDLCKSILEQQPPMPVRWLGLEVALGNKMVDEHLMYISIEDCRAVAESCNVADVDSAITFLHHQGIIVHHSKSPLVVLNPPWLMNLFTEIITIPSEQESNPRDARFYQLLSDGILMKEYLQRKIHGELLEKLMKQFSLICPWEYEGEVAYIVPSVAPLMKEGKDVQEEMSSSPIVPIFIDFNWLYVPLGFFTRFQINVINTCRTDLLKKAPQIYCNYTLLSFLRSESWFDVYLIKIPGKIKVGVVPKVAQNERACNEFVSYFRQVLEECMQKVLEEEPLMYRNVAYSLLVKCSVSCCGKTKTCRLQHGAAKCDRDECGFFWSLEEIEKSPKDPFCTHGSVGTGKFSRDSVKHWRNTDDSKKHTEDERCYHENSQASGNSSSSDILTKRRSKRHAKDKRCCYNNKRSKEHAEDECSYHGIKNSRNEIYKNMNDITTPPDLNISLPALKDIEPEVLAWSIIRAELPIDLLLVTVNDHEFASCFFYLENTKRSWCNGLGWVYIGKFGNGKVKVALIRCRKGSTEPCASLNVVKDAVRILKPKVAICIGHCGTVNPAKAKLGDVVISAKLATYDGNEESCRTKTDVSKNMGTLIPSAADGWEPPLKEPRDCEVNVHRDALVLTGAELVSIERRQELLNRFPDAIAVEMEGEGLYSAAHNLGIEWAVVKGISYFADGNKTETGNWQPFASAMASSLVSHMFKYSDVIHQWPHYQDPAQ